MKNFIRLILCTIIITTSLSFTSFAKTGDIIGYAKYTDISAYINHYPITSYNINGNTAVIAEDLANYGFDVAWDGNARTLTVTRGNSATITPYGTVYKYSSRVGQNSFPIYSTDIVTYVNNVQVESFAIGGKTCVYIDSLASYGELNWVPEQRATKLWISGLPTKDYAPLQEDPASIQVVTPVTTGGVTYANYSKITNGMSYEQVVKILGKQGSLLAESNVLNDSKYATKMYYWYDNTGIYNCTVMFQGGKVVSKAQVGLK